MDQLRLEPMRSILYLVSEDQRQTVRVMRLRSSDGEGFTFAISKAFATVEQEDGTGQIDMPLEANERNELVWISRELWLYDSVLPYEIVAQAMAPKTFAERSVVWKKHDAEVERTKLVAETADMVRRLKEDVAVERERMRALKKAEDIPRRYGFLSTLYEKGALSEESFKQEITKMFGLIKGEQDDEDS